jgi:hypothetical protein
MHQCDADAGHAPFQKKNLDKQVVSPNPYGPIASSSATFAN